MLYLCLIYDQDKAEKFLIYPWDIPLITVRNASNKNGYAWDEMTVLWTNYCLNFHFCNKFSNKIPSWTTFVKVFDSIISLESDKMNGLWQNDSLTFNLFETFSNNIPKGANFVK